MTTQETALCELLARGRDLSILREIISFATERLMELEVGGLTGAANRERSPDRREGEGGSLPASRFLDQPALEDSSLALGWQRGGGGGGGGSRISRMRRLRLRSSMRRWFGAPRAGC